MGLAQLADGQEDRGEDRNHTAGPDDDALRRLWGEGAPKGPVCDWTAEWKLRDEEKLIECDEHQQHHWRAQGPGFRPT